MYVLSCSRGSIGWRCGGPAMFMLAMTGVPLTGPPFTFMAICICWFCIATRVGEGRLRQAQSTASCGAGSVRAAGGSSNTRGRVVSWIAWWCCKRA